MDIKELQRNWNEFGKIDPLWAILTQPDKINNKWEINDFFRTGAQEIDTVINHIKTIHGNIDSHKKALDFGCGVGRLTQALSNHFEDVYGVDVAPSMIELANKYNKCEDKCHYILNVSNDLKLFEDNNFDFIYTRLVLQHMIPEYSKGYIKEFLRILAHKGILVFQIPSERNIPLSRLCKLSIQHLLNYLRPHDKMISEMKAPKMEMYGVKRREIINIIKKNNGSIIDIREDGAAGKEWISYCYYITKY